MISLGIESTAHTFGIGTVDEEGEVLSNEKETYRPEKGWGIKPTDAAEHHEVVKGDVFRRALTEGGVDMDEVDVVAFSQGPGLPPCLWKGMNFSKELSAKHDIPLFGVAHTVSHIEIGRLKTDVKDPITLYVSGGNTQVIGYASGRYRVMGEVLDTPLGNALDKFGRGVGMGFPAGPRIEELAKDGSKYIELPYSVKGMDLSFSGMVTEAKRKCGEGERLEDVCYSFQETAFAMLTEVVERGMAHAGKDEVLLTGGVAANRRLQEMLEIMCEERGGSFYAVPKEYTGDNGAMIAWMGVLLHDSGVKSLEEPDIRPEWRTDEVDVPWRR